MEQEQRAHQSHHDKLLQELVGQGFNCMFDQLGAVVHGDNFHTRRQGLLNLLQLDLQRVDGFQGIFAVAHHDDAARHFALAVQLRHAPADLRPFAQRRHLRKQDRHAVTHGDYHVGKIAEFFQVARGANHILRLPHFQQRTAAFLVGVLNGTDYLLMGDVQRAQAGWIQHHLILAYHAAHAGHFRHVGDGFQFKLQRPVLQRAQVGQAVLAAFIHQGILVHPADAGGVRPQCHLHLRRQ
ncbi:hypothetical protein D3C80_979680 [compost metagenome]